MKLPVTISEGRLVDADCKTVVATAYYDRQISDFHTDAEDYAHLAEIAAALNERDALRAKLAALVEALKQISELPRYDDNSILEAQRIAKAAIAAAEGGAE